MEILDLYKYFSFNKGNEERIKRVFKNNELYFSSPKDFNDPFDCKIMYSFDISEIELENYFKYLMAKNLPNISRSDKRKEIRIWGKKFRNPSIREELTREIGSHINELGMCCFSALKDNILMWSHYCEGHQGICLEFEANSTTPFFGRAQKVEYIREFKKVNIIRERADIRALLTKSIDWKYEEEWRIIDHENGPEYQRFPDNLLKGVILGFLMREESKKKIIQWTRERRVIPKLYQARIKDNEYGLEIEEYKNDR
jgi:hypothetical protein